MAREGLRHELTSALHKSVGSNESSHCPGLRVKTNGEFTLANLTILPIATGGTSTAHEPSLYLVILEQVRPSGPDPLQHRSLEPEYPALDADDRIASLMQELKTKEEYLQASNEELETSNEELKSANEEMQSVNAELQSTNEELETSKEELESINEELATVNSELQTKVADLSRANNDMNNLLAGTGIGTIFVDHTLHILRFTPAASTFINLILSDTGRPVGHIVSNLVGYNRLVEDTQEVLNTLFPKKVDVQTTHGKWYKMHIQPYRTLDNVVEGAVITFVDITEIKHANEMLLKVNELFNLSVVSRDANIAITVQLIRPSESSGPQVSRDANIAITVQDPNGRILAWNQGATRLYGWSEAEALAMNSRVRVPEKIKKEALSVIKQSDQGKLQEPYLSQRITKDGSVVDVWITTMPLLDETGRIYAIATTERKADTMVL